MKALIKNTFPLLIDSIGYLLSAIVCILLIGCKSDHEKNIISMIVEREKTINITCHLLGVQPRIYVSVVYSELINNFDNLDRFDEFRARIGANSSLGFAQIKVSTCFWIENNYSGYYGIYLSNSSKELVDKIVNDSINIHYSCFYIKLIHDMFHNTFQNHVVSAKNLASYYGIGIDEIDRKLDTLYSNKLGISADSFYYSNKLIGLFPR